MLPPQTLKQLVSAFLEQLPQVSSPVVIMVKPDRPSSPPSRTTGHRGKVHGPAYDPSLVFILEMVTVIAIRDQYTIASMGESVADALQNIVRDSVNVHITALSRAVYCLLRLLNASQVFCFFSMS